MREVYENGPVALNILAGDDLNFYKEGVYNPISPRILSENSRFAVEDWRKVDHSVLLIGWGIEEKTGYPYWLL